MIGDIRTVETDILVIGSGGAGLSSAVYAAKSGRNVLVIDKGAVGRSGNTVCAVQIAGAGTFSDASDSVDAYYKDTLESGRGLANPELVEVLVNELEERIEDLVQWGLKLDKEIDGQVKYYEMPGHTYPRGISTKKGNTGFSIVRVLIKQANKLPTIKRWSDVITVSLLQQRGNQVVGAIVYDLVHCEWVIIRSKAVVLTTGGLGQLYSVTTNPIQATGDGFSLALQAGATLVDMEQVQFYPVSLVYPTSIAGFCLSFYHLAKLYNSKGERFMERYDDENLENVTRDRLAQAIASEVNEGRGTVHGGVWLDVTDKVQQIKKEFPHEYDLCVSMGLDIATERIEVGPAAHFVMGGIQGWGDPAKYAQGLFVAGETAGGLHGGNRLVNNALSECVVFGARAGLEASDYVINTKTNKTDSELVNLNTVNELYKAINQPNVEGTYRPYQIKQRIQATMSQYVGVSRNEEDLYKAQQEITDIEQNLPTDTVIIGANQSLSRDVLDYMEVFHMLNTAKAIIGSAMLRNETRGAHARSDFPDTVDHPWHTNVKNIAGKLQFFKGSE